MINLQNVYVRDFTRAQVDEYRHVIASQRPELGAAIINAYNAEHCPDELDKLPTGDADALKLMDQDQLNALEIALEHIDVAVASSVPTKEWQIV